MLATVPPRARKAGKARRPGGRKSGSCRLPCCAGQGRARDRPGRRPPPPPFLSGPGSARPRARALRGGAAVAPPARGGRAALREARPAASAAMTVGAPPTRPVTSRTSRCGGRQRAPLPGRPAPPRVTAAGSRGGAASGPCLGPPPAGPSPGPRRSGRLLRAAFASGSGGRLPSWRPAARAPRRGAARLRRVFSGRSGRAAEPLFAVIRLKSHPPLEVAWPQFAVGAQHCRSAETAPGASLLQAR